MRPGAGFLVSSDTTGHIMSPATIAMAPAVTGEAMNLKTMFDTIRTTLNIKQAQAEAAVVPFQYRP